MWLRIILIGILVYLVVRMVSNFLSGPGKKGGEGKHDIKDTGRKKDFPGDVGEYVDYEEVDDGD